MITRRAPSGARICRSASAPRLARRASRVSSEVQPRGRRAVISVAASLAMLSRVHHRGLGAPSQQSSYGRGALTQPEHGPRSNGTLRRLDYGFDARIGLRRLLQVEGGKHLHGRAMTTEDSILTAIPLLTCPATRPRPFCLIGLVMAVADVAVCPDVLSTRGMERLGA